VVYFTTRNFSIFLEYSHQSESILKGQTFDLTLGSPRLSPCRENPRASVAYSFKNPAPWQPPAERFFLAPYVGIKTPTMGTNGRKFPHYIFPLQRKYTISRQKKQSKLDFYF
jgi:hypothetical protein